MGGIGPVVSWPQGYSLVVFLARLLPWPGRCYEALARFRGAYVVAREGLVVDRVVDVPLFGLGFGVRLHVLAVALLLPYSNGDLRLEGCVLLQAMRLVGHGPEAFGPRGFAGRRRANRFQVGLSAARPYMSLRAPLLSV